jgi:hypothetical protein
VVEKWRRNTAEGPDSTIAAKQTADQPVGPTEQRNQRSMSKEKWEDVAENTQRLGVEGGWLYRVGSAMTFVPTAIGATLDEISESLWNIKTTIEEATCELARPYGGEARAIRVANIGD